MMVKWGPVKSVSHACFASLRGPYYNSYRSLPTPQKKFYVYTSYLHACLSSLPRFFVWLDKKQLTVTWIATSNGFQDRPCNWWSVITYSFANMPPGVCCYMCSSMQSHGLCLELQQTTCVTASKHPFVVIVTASKKKLTVLHHHNFPFSKSSTDQSVWEDTRCDGLNPWISSRDNVEW